MPDHYKIVFALFVAVMQFAGCSATSGPADMGGEDGSRVALLVEDLNEVKHNPKKLADFFSIKPSAADSKKLNSMTFYVKGKPNVSGANATCNIQVEKQDGSPLGEVEWSFEKSSDAWKIKSAPLP